MSGLATINSAERIAMLKRKGNGGSFAAPFYWAHRGCSERAPEDTLSAWARAAADGYGMESDWRKSSDGTFVSMHDTTVNRTTNGSGTVTAMTAAALVALDAGSKWNPTGYSTERVPTLAQFLDLVRSTGGWAFLENSSAVQADALAMAAQIVASGAQDRCVLAQFGTPYTALTAVRAAYPYLKTQVLVLTAGAAPTPAALLAAGASYVSPDITDAYVTSAWVQSCQAVGTKVVPYTVDTLASRAIAAALPLDGLITGRPKLMQRGLAGGSPLNEIWKGETEWMWGDDWLFDNANYVGGLQYPRPFSGSCGTSLITLLNGGAICVGRPLPVAGESYQIDFTVILKVANADTTRWAAFQFALQQDSIVNAFGPVTPGENGYGAVLRQNGAFSIDKYVSGIASTSLASQAAASALVVDTPVQMRLTVTPTQIKLKRMDTAVELTTNDTAFRGGKAGLIWSNFAGHFGPFVGISL